MSNRWPCVAHRRAAHMPSNPHLWTAPPRNHDWIAARIGRG
jgi:hypothetical protein